MTERTDAAGGDGISTDKAQMEKLVHGHAEGIAFAEDLMRIAESGSDEDIAAAAERVHRYNLDELEAHLQHEEQTILGPLIRLHPEHAALCIAIGREHGLIRTLVEEMAPATARRDLAELGRVLKEHTLMEDRELFPLVGSLFTPEQLAAVENFTPFRRHEFLPADAPRPAAQKPEGDGQWLTAVEAHLERAGGGGSIVVLPRFDPDRIGEMAKHLGLRLFDYQKEVMEGAGKYADLIALDQLDATLSGEAEKGGILSHNVEALLCVKPENERRAWLRAFLDADWPNPVLLPITVFQADVPKGHPRVCEPDAAVQS